MQRIFLTLATATAFTDLGGDGPGGRYRKTGLQGATTGGTGASVVQLDRILCWRSRRWSVGRHGLVLPMLRDEPPYRVSVQSGVRRP